MLRTARRTASLSAAVAAMLLLSNVPFAQTPDEHASHHPSPENPATSPASEPAAHGNASGTVTGSDTMQAGEHRRDGGGLFAHLMSLGELTPQTREEAQRLARERMTAGVESMSRGIEKLQHASDPEDLAAMSSAVAEVRMGAQEFSSGTAALQALSNGGSPGEIALSWFRESTRLEEPDESAWWQLSAFHYLVMAVLLTTAAGLLFLNYKKMRRAEILVARLAPEPALRAAARPLEAASIPTPKSDPQTPPVSRSNSWTGLMRVVRIFEETPNVRTLRLVDANGGPIPFDYLPGQFVTVSVRPNDQEVKRSYTIASSPTRGEYLEITVKREELGTVSNFLHGVHEGDTIRIIGPSGSFTFLGEGANSIVLIAGGVGVTPMMSVLRYLTDRSWSGDIYFIYACRTDLDAIYREELAYLQRRLPNLHLLIVAAEVNEGSWAYARGMLTKEMLTAHVPHLATRRIHLCGPPKMMDAVKTSLTDLGVPAERVKTEVFIGKERPAATAVAEENSKSTTIDKTHAEPVSVVTFERSQRTAMLPPERTILEGAEEVGVNIDYSCRVGVCGLCKVKLLSGEVSMAVQESLTAEDRKQCLVLACQAKPQGDVRVDA